jgi:hypothetical protein
VLHAASATTSTSRRTRTRHHHQHAATPTTHAHARARPPPPAANRNLTTQLQDCGKRFFPCGAAARRIGCPEAGVQCSNAAEDFCAAPSDTMLGASRCLPLPLRCGKRNNACCPGNTGGTTKAVWAQDGVTPIPYCSDNTSFCVWKHQDYTVAGLQILNEAGYGKTLLWDGYFQRGYGQSRCAPLPASCGNPGEPCCPSMLDQRLSGMVHNRRFRYQPCNYNAAGKVGIFCKVGPRSCLCVCVCGCGCGCGLGAFESTACVVDCSRCVRVLWGPVPWRCSCVLR